MILDTKKLMEEIEKKQQLESRLKVLESTLEKMTSTLNRFLAKDNIRMEIKNK